MLSSSAPEEFAEPKSQVFIGRRTMLILELSASGSIRKSPSLAVHALGVGEASSLAGSGNEIGASAGR